MSELKQVDPALAEILAQHNRKVKPAEFAPRLHCLKVCGAFCFPPTNPAPPLEITPRVTHEQLRSR